MTVGVSGGRFYSVGAGVPGSTTGPRELYDATLSSLRSVARPFVNCSSASMQMRPSESTAICWRSVSK